MNEFDDRPDSGGEIDHAQDNLNVYNQIYQTVITEYVDAWVNHDASHFTMFTRIAFSLAKEAFHRKTYVEILAGERGYLDIMPEVTPEDCAIVDSAKWINADLNGRVKKK